MVHSMFFHRIPTTARKVRDLNSRQTPLPTACVTGVTGVISVTNVTGIICDGVKLNKTLYDCDISFVLPLLDAIFAHNTASRGG